MNKGLVTVSLLLCFVTPSLWVSLEPPALTQTQSVRKTKAERLLKLCRENLSKNQPEAAIQSCQQAVTAYQQIEDRQGEANSINNLGLAYYSLGQYAKAIEYYQQSLAIFKNIGNRNGEANSLNNLGNAYYSLGQYAKSIEYHEQSLAIFKEIGNKEREAYSLRSLGSAYYDLGKYTKAIEYFQQSLSISKDIGNKEIEGMTLSNIGASYEKQNQPELAIVFYKQSVNVREGIRQDLRTLNRQLQESYTQTVADTYRRLADLLLSQGRILEAQQVLELLKISNSKFKF